MKPAILTPLARRDLDSAVRWIAKDNRMAARGLRNAVEEAAKRIGIYPHIGMQRPDIVEGPFRFLTLNGYPYVLVYNPDLSPPEILRVLHGARDMPSLLGGR